MKFSGSNKDNTTAPQKWKALREIRKISSGSNRIIIVDAAFFKKEFHI